MPLRERVEPPSLDHVLTLALAATGASGGGIYLFDAAGRLERHARIGALPPLAPALAAMLPQALAAGEPVPCPADVAAGAWAAPIALGSVPLGALILVTDGRVLDDRSRDCLRALTAHLAELVMLSGTLEGFAARARLAELGVEVAAALTRGESLRDMLQRCAEAVVRHLDAALARIWTLNEADQVLTLEASAGLYTHLDGEHGRIPVGDLKVGRIARERAPHVTNQVIGDPRIPSQEWARREGLVAFAGYPLLVDDRVVGVLAMFARHPLTAFAVEALASVADAVAVGIRRRLSDEAVRRLMVAVEHSPSSVIVTDAAGTIQYVNAAFTQVTGYTAAEAVGKKPSLIKSGKTPPAVYQDLWSTIKSGRTFRGEIENRKKSGELFWNAVSISAVRDGAGRITNFVGVQADITERKRAEEALRASEERFRQLAENISEVFFVVAADFAETVYVNPAYERIWGRSRDSVYQAPRAFMDAIPVEDRERLAAHVAEIRAGRDPGGLEFRVVRPDGTVRTVLSHAIPLLDDLGRTYRIAGVAVDITERKRAEDALRASERRLHTLFETVNLIVLELDAAGRVAYVNPFFLRLTDYPPDAVLGHDWFGLLPEAQRAALRAKFADVLERDLHAHYENSIVTQAGQERMISWHNTVLRDADGRPTGTLSIGEDITEHARLEEQFRQAQKMEAVGRLAGGVAHDFNNVLTAILSYADLALEDLRPEDPLAQDLQEIRKAGQRATAITRQLLAFSRQQVLAPRVLDLNEVVTGIQKMLHRLVGEDVAVHTALAPSLGRVRADPGQLEQVIVNLAVNARDAMPRGGKLTLETADVELAETRTRDLATVLAGRYVMLAVTDTGHGMDEQTQAQVFEPFFTTKGPGQGTGLGLSTVYGIVKQSGGFIWVYSEPDHGTTFKVYLPRVDAAAEPAAPAPGAATPSRGSETILLVEDEEAVRTIARTTLTRRGYRLLAAGNGGEALLLGEREAGPIHLLLTDVVMPVMGGPDLARRLTRMHPEMQVLFMSGYADRTAELHGLVASGAAFLEKPFTPEALLRRVREALGRRVVTS